MVSINGGAKGRYYYDGESKRIRKDYAGSYVVYLYDQWGNLIAETDIFGGLICEYIWANGRLIAKIYQQDFLPGFSGEAGIESEAPGPPPVEYVFYYHLDHLGTPLALTDQNRSIHWAADYLPFGEIYNELIVSASNEIRFPGQYHDRETGLYYNYFRYYNPKTGRYITPDPIGLDGGINLFAYVQNNPVNEIDPVGLISLPDIELYFEERAMRQLAEEHTVAAFIDVSGASAACLAKCMLVPGGVKASEKLAGPKAGKWGAMAWYHFKDKRFKAWGRFSSKLVPKLGAKIASGISIVGWAWMAYEAYKCIKECQKSPCDR